MRVHLVGICGTGMGSLALLFREAGHEVTGSDAAFDPPIGAALREATIRCFEGYAAAHLDEAPDLVIVGNAIRRDNAEAMAAEARGLCRASMSGALREHFLARRRPLVVCGTHGKTTTSTMCAWILVHAGLEPGYFIGGIPKNLPSGAALGGARRKLTGAALLEGFSSADPVPFVVEGDEYDAVYWHKQPKFLDYVGVTARDVVILTSVEHDHVDIYPDEARYEAAFRALLSAVPEGGLVVCDGHDTRARALVSEHGHARTVFYALERDATGDVAPTWLAAPGTVDERGAQQFDLYAGGVSCGRFSMPVAGTHNVRNAVAAIAACAEGFGVPVTSARQALWRFDGVRRRQDLLGEPDGVRIYDDFAHHPTAVSETLHALRARHPTGTLWAVFEPRSATACRSVHQQLYASAFDAADRVIVAPVGRANIPDGQRLDVAALAYALGPKAEAATDVAAIAARLAAGVQPGDTVAILSNGIFGGLHARVLLLLTAREQARGTHGPAHP